VPVPYANTSTVVETITTTRGYEGDHFPSPLFVRESADGRGFATRSIASALPSTMPLKIASQIKIFVGHE
jgi:hypothetical protein